MANNNVMKITAADFEEVVRKAVNQRMQIAGATGQGGSPGQLYKPPVTNPGRGEAVYGTEKDGQKFFEFLKASTQIKPNQIMLPFVPKDAETDEQYGDGVDRIEGKDLQAHSPSGTYDDYGRELKIAPYKGGNPGGQQIEIPWMKEEYEKKHPQLEQLHNEKYHQARATSRQIRDKLKPYTKGGPADYDKEGGSLRNLPASLRIQLLKA